MNVLDLWNIDEGFVDFLGAALGTNCEVVLQDVREGRVRAIANGQVSGRAVGAPLTDYALGIIKSGIWKERDYDVNYQGRTADDHELRSSTYFIKDPNSKELLGMLCINIDTKPFKDIAAAVSALEALSREPRPAEEPRNEEPAPPERRLENFSRSVPQLAASLLPGTLGLSADFPLTRLNQDEKIKIMEALAQQGVFKIKGSIPEVAKAFDCSEATIYRYLSKIET